MEQSLRGCSIQNVDFSFWVQAISATFTKLNFFDFSPLWKTVYTLSYIYMSTALYNLQGSARHIESDMKKIGLRFSEVRNFEKKSCFMVSQFNFSSQNLSMEHNFFKWDGKATKIWRLLFHRIWKNIVYETIGLPMHAHPNMHVQMFFASDFNGRIVHNPLQLPSKVEYLWLLENTSKSVI